ncbi:RING-H2 finger protein ATL60-like [Phalaenopsis equestris]|uniref:RING-H2 finger protein ATL60-like n=1 Tax=Phalaenopsis equestris TaxID=78828 RepID=UPI0009E5E411|nr:RING-H2 finger protein ATL60-like [Phalaenopsis equestris]
MGDKNPSSALGNNTDVSTTTAKINNIAMVLTLVFVFLVFIFSILLYIYTHKSLIGRSTTRRRRAAQTHLIFATGDAPIPTLGLNPSILLSLPITIYRPNDFEESLECAVCLSELSDGEKVRRLPNCNHGFHLECIDMWFYSHSTCPLCRCAVGLSESAGSDTELAIPIPDRSTEMYQLSLPRLNSSRSQVEEMKTFDAERSPARLNVGSLKRIMSGEKMVGGSCCSNHGVCDIEQGLMGCGEVNGVGSSVLPIREKGLS